jgi:RNA polymerase sigma-70 factor (ECF subfamily)
MGQSQLEFEAFYAAAKDDCLRTVFACTGDLHRAEDLVAEAFARAWASWGRVAQHPAPRAWIVRTALNQGVSVWRRRRRELPLADLTGWEPAVDAVQQGIEWDLNAAVLALPPRQRQVVALRVFLDLDTAATARALGIAQGTVRALLSQAMAALRTAIDTPGQRERSR